MPQDKYPKINFPFSDQLKILAKALNSNDELRLVGGCVRDFIIGKKISDIDLACKHSPEKIIEILKQHNIKSVPTGIKHGTITAIIDGYNFEITTLRQDVKTYGRFAEVEFVDDFYLDAKRRDFTINAMSIDFDSNLHDYFGGVEDLKNHLVKFIGDPLLRIKEDYLRILRFFRFSCHYSNHLDPKGLEAVIKYKNEINNLSKDRIRNELIKTISCINSNISQGDCDYNLIKILSAMQENGLLDLILIEDYFDLKYLNNLLFLEKKLSRKFDYRLRFIALIYSQKKYFLPIAKKLNFSNKEIKFMEAIVNTRFVIDFNMSKNDLIGLLFESEASVIINSFIVNLASLEANNISDDIVEKILSIEKILLNEEAPKFLIDGNDLLKIGIQGELVGQMLKLGRQYWIKNNFASSKNEIIEIIKKAI